MKCNCNNCYTDNEDNGYKYILDELKRIRADIDSTINLLENRIEKDNIIDNILSEDYEDCEEKNNTFTDEDLENMIKALKRLKTHTPPFHSSIYTATFPSNTTWYPGQAWYWY